MHHNLTDALAEGLHLSPPQWLDRRFDSLGRPLPDGGCTIIAPLRDPAVMEALRAVQARLAAEGLDRFWAWLPESSWHMTIFDLILHQRREADRWPEGLDPGLPDAEADTAMIARMKDYPLGDTPPWLVAPQGIYRGEGGVGIALKGASKTENARLRTLRDRLADHAGLRHRPGHEVYRFHITLAYMIAWPDAAEAARADTLFAGAEAALKAALPTIALETVELCRFADMTAFPPAATLR